MCSRRDPASDASALRDLAFAPAAALAPNSAVSLEFPCRFELAYRNPINTSDAAGFNRFDQKICEPQDLYGNGRCDYLARPRCAALEHDSCARAAGIGIRFQNALLLSRSQFGAYQLAVRRCGDIVGC